MNLKEDVVLVERADLAVLVVNGADRQTWLNGLVTCDLTKAVPERANYGLACWRMSSW
jgi:folate-binding Fe-S cluster repair protein YgfZ